MIQRRDMAIILGIMLVSVIVNPLRVAAPAISQLEEHEPILITGDEDLITMAGEEDWPGTGSEESPIVIKGLSITSEGFGIHITDTDLHFRIEECTITSSETVYWCFGILIENCTNASIEKCIIWSHEFGICLSNSDGAYVYRTEIYESLFGVFVNESSDVWLHSLDIIVCKVGIRLNHSINTYVDQTIVEYSEYSGIECFGDEGTVLRHNQVIGSEKGVQMVVNENWVLEESKIASCEKGIEAFLTSGGFVIRSMIENCSTYGIDLGSTSHNISIVENWIGPDNAQNAKDDGECNFWYDEYSQQGNYWSNYTGEGPYLIPGEAGSVDLYPTSLEEAPNWEDVNTIDWSTTIDETTTPNDSPQIDEQILILVSTVSVIVLLVGIAMTRSRVSPGIR
ncbi:MAG: NosD domain-containing protein [Candidatus Thorarchaeota archaeon]